MYHSREGENLSNAQTKQQEICQYFSNPSGSLSVSAMSMGIKTVLWAVVYPGYWFTP